MLSERSESMTRGHSERLLPLFADSVEGFDRRQVSAVIVCTGPGGFAGPRAGVAVARGLGLALGARVCGVTRFEALAAKMGPDRSGLAILPLGGGSLAFQRIREGRVVGAPKMIRSDDHMPALEPGEAPLNETAFDSTGLVDIAKAAWCAVEQGLPRPLYLRDPDASPSAKRPHLVG